jgi:hypothetical protein
MGRCDRRDTLKLAGGAALAGALAVGTCFAAGDSDNKPSTPQPKKKKRKLNHTDYKSYTGTVTTILAGNGWFTFGFVDSITNTSMGFNIDDPITDELSVRIVMLAYDKGKTLTVLVDPNQLKEAVIVSAS